MQDDTEVNGPRRRRSGSALEAYLGAVIGGAFIVLAALARLEGQILPGSGKTVFLVFVGLLVAGEVKPVKWLRLDDGGEVTMSWAFALALLFVGPVTGAVAALGLASVIGDLSHRKPLRRTLFNAAQLVIALGAAGTLLELSGERTALVDHSRLGALWFVAVVIASVVAFLINGALTCIALALHEGTSVRQMLRRGVLPNLSTDGALLALAPCFVVIAERSLLLLPLVLVTATFVYRSSRAALMSEHEANHDALTALLNRRAFDELLTSCFDNARMDALFAVALIDLNGFKSINDRLGHHVGDHVLQEVGRRLVEARRPNMIAARLGGDEFAVLFTHVDSEADALELGWELHRLLAQDSVINGYPLAIGGSVGVAIAPDHGDNPELLLRNADVAMYKAKRGKTCVELFSREGEHRDVGRLQLLSDLPAALRDEQLVVHYQPQLDITTGDLVAIEALIRWQHPVLGLIPPGEFMPVAEHTEMMDEITLYVLDRALATCGRFRARGHHLRVAVNASAQNLRNLRFPEAVFDALVRAGLPTSALELDLTENTVLAEPARVRSVLDQLSDAGVRLALDDFGTGYSSISNLRDLPIDVIKIDRSFVRDLATDADDQRIVRSLIDLAHGLRLEVASEGVEDAEVLELLAQYGSDSAQGYLLAYPMSEDDLVRFVSDRTALVELKEAS